MKATLKYAAVAACFGNYKLSAQVVEHIWKTLWNYKFGNSWLCADASMVFSHRTAQAPDCQKQMGSNLGAQSPMANYVSQHYILQIGIGR